MYNNYFEMGAIALCSVEEVKECILLGGHLVFLDIC